ncbi:MAG: hypothetical protein JRN57_01165 [Nitrososphaerota archaeon]|nr:hypothetical protein [Nitrososphaerota archaeon]MDG7010705.1 hypothetical protein [Nitrososphaerota archaeon]
MSAGVSKRAILKSLAIGVGAAMGLTALGFDTSVSLSTYGLYLGAYGPFAVIAGVPILLNFAFAFALLKADQKFIRYSMVVTSLVMSLGVGYLLFVGIFQVLIPGR